MTDETKILSFLNNTAASKEAVADLTSLDSDGFTLNWSSVDGAAKIVSYMAFGEAPAAFGDAVPQCWRQYRTRRG